MLPSVLWIWMDSGPSESLNPSLHILQTTKQLFAFEHYAKAWDGPLEPLLRESNFLYCLNFNSCVWEWCNICFKTPRRWNQAGLHRFSIFWPMIYTVWQHRLADFQCFALSSCHCGWKELRAVGQGKGSDVLQQSRILGGNSLLEIFRLLDIFQQSTESSTLSLASYDRYTLLAVVWLRMSL